MRILILIMLFFMVGCDKDVDPLAHFKSNRIAFTVHYPNGDSISETFTGSNAPMTRYAPDNYFNAEGKISSNERKIIFGADSTNARVSCLYFPNGNVNPYSTSRAANPGTIRFTALQDQFAAGSFEANCLGFSDSIIITGTFSGFYVR